METYYFTEVAERDYVSTILSGILVEWADANDGFSLTTLTADSLGIIVDSANEQTIKLAAAFIRGFRAGRKFKPEDVFDGR